jgi:hypothetical protein
VREGVCIHYRGLRGTPNDCALGLDIEKVTGGERFGIALRMPCCRNLTMGRKPEDLPKRATCDKYQEPTAEEIAKHEADFKVYAQNATKAREAIIKHAGVTRGFVQNKMPCPICQKGELHYRIEPNGHVRSQCTTKECINFIE